MKTKKSNSKYLAELTGDFKKVADRYEGQKDKGYVFVAYDKDDEDTIANAYHGAGSPVDLAECLYACMKRDQTLANVVITAASAFMSTRAAEEAHRMAEIQKPKN